MPLVCAVMHLYYTFSLKKKVFVHSLKQLKRNLVSINQTMRPACPSLMCSFIRGNIEGTNSSKIYVSCLCMYDLFSVCVGTGFVD